MKEKYNGFVFDDNRTIQILEYTTSGRVKKIQIGNISLAGTELRSLLGLKSTNFNVEVTEENITFKVIGYGHGVGMSQTGADFLAKQGYLYKEIIKHYYTGVEVTDIKIN